MTSIVKFDISASKRLDYPVAGGPDQLETATWKIHAMSTRVHVATFPLLDPIPVMVRFRTKVKFTIPAIYKG